MSSLSQYRGRQSPPRPIRSRELEMAKVILSERRPSPYPIAYEVLAEELLAEPVAEPVAEAVAEPVAEELTTRIEKSFHYKCDTGLIAHKVAQKDIPLLAVGVWTNPDTQKKLRDDATEYLLLHPDLKGVTINYKVKALYFHKAIHPDEIYDGNHKMMPRQRRHEHHDLIVKN